MSQNVLMMDCGDGQRRADNGCVYQYPKVAKTAAYTVKSTDAGKLFTNKGATGAVVFTLPTVKQGLWFRFAVYAAQTLTITAAGGAKINGSAANGTYSAAGTQALAGNALVWSDGENWYVNSLGSWTTT